MYDARLKDFANKIGGLYEHITGDMWIRWDDESFSLDRLSREIAVYGLGCYYRTEQGHNWLVITSGDMIIF